MTNHQWAFFVVFWLSGFDSPSLSGLCTVQGNRQNDGNLSRGLTVMANPPMALWRCFPIMPD
ncbi:MAG TPA: hypothetical protein DDZ51_00920 [Planctomycetaceae bacterium]|nr:hypothetical protein [Planctomycetaceae bacterium]